MLSGFSRALLINCASVMKNVLSEQHQRGAANGLAMTVVSLTKTASPAVGGALFSWSQKRQDAGFLPGNQMVFFILNLVEALGVILTSKPFLTQRAPGFTVERPDFDLLQNLGIP
ncbi:hypothetical protein KPL70_014457 [Citrus sinensis]|nr:hypothetical protein KPL70_014457 [Citrus sinensis]